LKTFPHIKINTEVVRGKKVQKEIIEKANELHAELVVITKKATGKWFPFFNAVNATCIVKETKAAVLMVNPEAIPNKIKSVVFPVHSFVPNRNIELLSTLTGKHKATIHLATACCKEQNDVQTSVFVDTYRTLSDLLHYPLDYKVLNGDNFVKSVLSYGKKITADLVFVNTVEEAAFNSFYNADIGNMIPADAKQCIVISNIM
jgi:hypothetical protein